MVGKAASLINHQNCEMCAMPQAAARNVKTDKLTDVRRGNPHPNTVHLKRTAGPGRPKGSRNKLTEARVEEELRRIALFDPRTIIGRLGRGQSATFTLKAIADLPEDVAACIASYDVVLGNENKSDGQLETAVRVRWYNKQVALELCAKHFGYVKDHVVVEGLEERKARLNAALARVGKAGT